MEFDPAGQPPCYKSKEEDMVIKQDDEIRLKIVGTRIDAGGIVSSTLCLFVYRTQYIYIICIYQPLFLYAIINLFCFLVVFVCIKAYSSRV